MNRRKFWILGPTIALVAGAGCAETSDAMLEAEGVGTMQAALEDWCNPASIDVNAYYYLRNPTRALKLSMDASGFVAPAAESATSDSAKWKFTRKSGTTDQFYIDRKGGSSATGRLACDWLDPVPMTATGMPLAQGVEMSKTVKRATWQLVPTGDGRCWMKCQSSAHPVPDVTANNVYMTDYGIVGALYMLDGGDVYVADSTDGNMGWNTRKWSVDVVSSAPPPTDPCAGVQHSGSAYYVSASGNDSHAGTQSCPFKTLAHAASHLANNTQLYLKGGDTFTGTIEFQGLSGVTIGAYGTGVPHINSAGYLAGVEFFNSSNVTVRDLKITSKQGSMVDPADPVAERYGVHFRVLDGGNYANVLLQNLTIEDIFSTSLNSRGGYGGYAVYGRVQSGTLTGLTVDGLDVSRTGFMGIFLQGKRDFKDTYEDPYDDVLSFRDVQLINNSTFQTGGSGMNALTVEDLLVSNNITDQSGWAGGGSSPAAYARGSGFWNHNCRRTTISDNRFLNARGSLDSAGVHVDFRNQDTIVERNFTMNNEGAAIEILKSQNTIWRHNIHVNDGWRGYGKLGTAIFLSPFCDTYCDQTPGGAAVGSANTYIYNNTLYWGPDFQGSAIRFEIDNSQLDLAIMNNVFHDAKGLPEAAINTGSPLYNPTVRFKKNVYYNVSLPAGLPWTDTNPISQNPNFASAGGSLPANYKPLNSALWDSGDRVWKLPADTHGGWELIQTRFDAVNKLVCDGPYVTALDPVAVGAIEADNPSCSCTISDCLNLQ
jgi:hypothetical protein